MKFTLLMMTVMMIAQLPLAAHAGKVYYTRETVETECRNVGKNMGTGAIIGGVGGVILGGLLGGKRGAVVGGVTGLAGGAVLGGALSCKERVRYVSHMDRCLGSPDIRDYDESGYSTKYARARVIATGYGPRGMVCKTYVGTYIRYNSWGEAQPVRETSTACFHHGAWHHNYSYNVYQRMGYVHPRYEDRFTVGVRIDINSRRGYSDRYDRYERYDRYNRPMSHYQ